MSRTPFLLLALLSLTVVSSATALTTVNIKGGGSSFPEAAISGQISKYLTTTDWTANYQGSLTYEAGSDDPSPQIALLSVTHSHSNSVGSELKIQMSSQFEFRVLI